MSKRPAETTLGSSKRKHFSLSISKKVELLKKLENGTSVKRLSEEYGIGTSTIYDLKKQKGSLLKFYANSDVSKLMENRKTLHTAKNVDIDKVLMEWIRQRRSEKFPLDRSIIMAQAKVFHVELGLTTSCEYSAGWFAKFKKRYGLRILKICGEKASADQEAAELYLDEFSSLISEEKLSPEQVYNADETSLYWRYIPKKTYATTDESAPSGFKDAKERLTVLACANAAGTHKCKLLIVGKSKKPRAFKGVKVFPALYRANKRAWITRQICLDWFENHFVPEARAHCQSVGLPNDCKILLLLDNCSAHPDAKLLIRNNVYATYLPPNCTSLIQPMDQGILRAFKCRYKAEFIRKLLNACNSGLDINKFQKEFNVKDVIYSAANSWDNIPKDILINGWHNLWPSTIFVDGEEDPEPDFCGFRVSHEKQITAELMQYAKVLTCEEAKMLDEEAVEDCLNVDNDAPVVLQLTDSEIIQLVVNPDQENTNESDSEEDDEEKISTDQCINLCDQLIRGLEQKSFISEQQIMWVHKIQEALIKEKPKHMKQVKKNYSEVKL